MIVFLLLVFKHSIFAKEYAVIFDTDIVRFELIICSLSVNKEYKDRLLSDIGEIHKDLQVPSMGCVRYRLGHLLQFTLLK